MARWGVVSELGLVLVASLWSAASIGATDIVVVRVGDGSAGLGATAAPVFLERRTSGGTAVGSPIALPTANGVTNNAFTLTGNSTSEGALAVSSDGNYLTLAGYAALPGADPTTATRVVARVDSSGNIDTTTTMSNSFASGVRGAVTVDGTAFWISGNGSGDGGIFWEVLGLNGGNQILSSPNSTRVVNIFAGQLYADSGSGSFTNVFTVGTGVPTTIGLTATSLAGLPTSSESPYGFQFFDRAAISGLDTLYIADDRTVASGGGIQKWTWNGTTWTRQTTFTNGLSTGVRGLAAEAVGAHVVLYATTADATLNKLVSVVDDGTASPAFSVLATASANTLYRGVALAWSPPLLDRIFDDGFE